jgi:hypothetical protein
LKDETVETLATAMEDAAAKVSGGSDLRSSVGEVIRLLEWLLTILRQFQSPEQIRLDLQKLDEPSPATLSLISGSLGHSPRLIKAWFRFKLKEAKSELGSESNGRPNSIPVERRGQVCDEVASLERKGYTLGRAKKYLAKKYAVNGRTIHRIWGDRAKYPTGKGVTLAEAKAFADDIWEMS